MGTSKSEYRPRRPSAGALHQAVREGWPQVAAKLHLPARVHAEVRRYLRRGDPRHGFAQVKCTSCKASTRSAFSCKGRGWCPSCGARRAYDTALHLVRRLLWLIPPPRGLHLTNFHGAFASHYSVRASVLLPLPEPPDPRLAPQPGVPAEGAAATAAAPFRKRPRVDWASLQRHTFGRDVWQCSCGGRRRVVGVVTSARTAEEVLRNLGLWQPWPTLPAAQGLLQRVLVLDC